MSTAVAHGNGRPPAEIMEGVLMKGDLSKLSPNERNDYYMAVCKSVGLNPLTKPFEYITLNGRLTLYALRTCTDQLRSIHGVSVVDMASTDRDGLHVVTVKVSDKHGRTDMATGAVSVANAKGEMLANLLMKAETKAKRRATLSICGLGFLDETEVEDIPNKDVGGVSKPAGNVGRYTTTPEDVADEPTENDPIPQYAGPPIKRYTNAEARSVPGAQGEAETWIRKAQSFTDLAEALSWAKEPETVKTLARLPIAWERAYRNKFAEHVASLSTAAKPTTIFSSGGEPPSDGNPESFLRWVEMVLSTVTDPSKLEAAWNLRIEPHTGRLFPPDKDEALKIYARHEARLANG